MYNSYVLIFILTTGKLSSVRSSLTTRPPRSTGNIYILMYIHIYIIYIYTYIRINSYTYMYKSYILIFIHTTGEL